MNKPDCEHRYNAGDVADITGIPFGTLRRWRWQGALLVEHDYLCDRVMRLRIDQAGDGPIRGPIDPACFGKNDVTRLLAVGLLGRAGWDRNRLLQTLWRPLAEPGEKQPRWLSIWLDGKGVLFSKGLYTASGVAVTLQDHAVATILGLETISAGADLLLKNLDAKRERKAAQQQNTELETV
ncbi:MAG: hypothetical protein WBY44_16045 [Bryobacteraceae bacterium]